HNSLVSTDGEHFLLLAQTGCPGPSSLLWLNPATGATKTVLSAQAGQAGVLAAVPEGLGPPATSAG
ncbi:MAG: hypothetical protein J2P28_15915, partial [Actinobacteria bacterium]|nr:hypothetical protein [Actinomycetota bacterium]